MVKIYEVMWNNGITLKGLKCITAENKIKEKRSVNQTLEQKQSVMYKFKFAKSGNRVVIKSVEIRSTSHNFTDQYE